MHIKIKYTGIVAYTFLNICEKIHQFLLSIKKMHTKENWFLFSASQCRTFIYVTYIYRERQTVCHSLSSSSCLNKIFQILIHDIK